MVTQHEISAHNQRVTDDTRRMGLIKVRLNSVLAAALGTPVSARMYDDCLRYVDGTASTYIYRAWMHCPETESWASTEGRGYSQLDAMRAALAKAIWETRQ